MRSYARLFVSASLFAAPAVVVGNLSLDQLADLQKQLPKCAVQCIADGATKHDCDLIDIDCQCDKIVAITRDVAPCLVKAGCRLKEVTDTVSVVNTICKKNAAQNSSSPSGNSGNRETGTGTATETNQPSTTSAAVATQSSDVAPAGRSWSAGAAVIAIAAIFI